MDRICAQPLARVFMIRATISLRMLASAFDFCHITS